MDEKFSRAFYDSQAWKVCRDSYKRSKGGLCEECLRNGIINPGVDVHHVEKLTVDNIGNPNVTLNWNNLRLLCRDCHAKQHAKNKRRYIIDKITGNVEIR